MPPSPSLANRPTAVPDRSETAVGQRYSRRSSLGRNGDLLISREDLVGMFPVQRPRRPQRRSYPSEIDRERDLLERPGRMVDGADHADRGGVRVAVDLVEMPDGGDRHAVVFQDAAPVLHRPGRERRGEDLVEFAAMLDAITIAEEPHIG